MDGGGGLAVELLIEDGFQQRLERRWRCVEAKSEQADAVNQKAEFGVLRAEMRERFFAVVGQLLAGASGVRHYGSLSQSAVPAIHRRPNQSRRKTVSNDLCTRMRLLYAMKPSLRKRVMKVLTRGRVLPIMLARASWLMGASSGASSPG